MTELAERVAVLENEVTNMKQSFKDFYKEDLATKAAILDEIKKFNNLVTRGKGGIAMLAATGAFLIWLYGQIKPWLIGQH